MHTRHLFLVTLLCASAAAAQSLPGAGAPFPRFSMAPGKVDNDGWPLSGAKLCALPDKTVCYTMPSQQADAKDPYQWQFGIYPAAERLSLPGGGSWIFFSADFCAGGSGSMDRLAILRFDPMTPSKITNLLPFIGATNISERAAWTVPQVSPYPVLVHADFIWGDGESHFEPHRFTVEAWRFDPKADHFVKIMTYNTAGKYIAGDAEAMPNQHAPSHVLEHERATIIAKISGK